MFIMNKENWLSKNTESLSGKTVAVSGSTGGLGMKLCDQLASLGADLILLDRNRQRSEAHKLLLENKYRNIKIELITVDFENIDSVAAATEILKASVPDILVINAGAYSIPRHKCIGVYDNVFMINFAAPYYMVRELLPAMRERRGRVIAVGSIAHGYSHTDSADIDFSSRSAASKVYGNAKRHLMFSLYELFRDEHAASLSVVHPGITFTNITAHYPRLIFAVIKHPMKLIFMSPEKAALSILRGAFEHTGYHEWIGPRIFNVWGIPSKKKLKSVSIDESEYIFRTAEEVYANLKK